MLSPLWGLGQGRRRVVDEDSTSVRGKSGRVCVWVCVSVFWVCLQHYIRLTALRNLDDLDENFFVTFWSGKKPNGRSPDDGATPMLWLVVCAAVLCLWAMLAAFFCSSTICWKRARIDGGRGWTVGPAVSGPGRGVVGSGSVIQAA